MTGLEIISKERHRQISEEGYTINSDQENDNEELACAAAAYATPKMKRTYLYRWDRDKGYIPSIFPKEWMIKYWKPSPDNRIKELAKAGALIAAEIDRLLNIE